MSDTETVPQQPFPPFLGLSGSEAAYEVARFAVLCSPDPPAGALSGPQAILRASQSLQRFDEEAHFEPCRLGIFTAPPMTAGADPIRRSVADTLRAGKTHILLADNPEGAIAAAETSVDSAGVRLSVVRLAARASMEEGGALRTLSERAPLVQVGVRTCTETEMPALDQGLVRTHMMHAVRQRPFEETVTEVAETVRPHVHLIVELDALDPAVMPAVDRPEPGGLQWWEAIATLRSVISRATVVGAAVVGLRPVAGQPSHDHAAARLVYKIISYTARFQAHWQTESTSPRPALGDEDDKTTVSL